ncbi:MAG: YlbF family regulator [Verrucomicrobiota bacterium]
MSALAANSAVLEKTRALCAEIAGDATVRRLQDEVERFLANDEARLQYQSVHEQGEQLHEKQHSGIELGKAEIKSFEDARSSLFGNPLAVGFMEAQQTLTGLQKQIGQYVGLTLELGRVPTAEDIENASGGGCCGGHDEGGGCCSH